MAYILGMIHEAINRCTYIVIESKMTISYFIIIEENSKKKFLYSCIKNDLGSISYNSIELKGLFH